MASFFSLARYRVGMLKPRDEFLRSCAGDARCRAGHRPGRVSLFCASGQRFSQIFTVISWWASHVERESRGLCYARVLRPGVFVGHDFLPAVFCPSCAPVRHPPLNYFFFTAEHASRHHRCIRSVLFKAQLCRRDSRMRHI